jgi:hypothetical protein
MATKTVAKKSPKKDGAKKKQKRLPFIELKEIVQCWLMAYETVEGAPMLIYRRALDETIRAAWVHPKTDLKYLKFAFKEQKEIKGSFPAWIALWEESTLALSSKLPKLSQVVVGNIAGYLFDLLEQLKSPKANALPSVIVSLKPEKKVRKKAA